MFHPHETTYPNFTYLPHQSHSTIPNISLGPLFSQPVLHPTSIDPYAHSSLYPSIHVVLGAQATSYEDPNAVSQNWVVKNAGPITYEPAVKPSNEKAVVSTSLNSLWSNNQPLVNDMTIRIPEQTKVIQSLRCEVCNIDCNSKDVLEKHISGKKHNRNLQIHTNQVSTTISTKDSIGMNTGSLVGQIGSISHQRILASAGAAAGQSLVAKRLKLVEGGAVADSVRTCTICNVACNSQVVFLKHLTGKKHAAQVGLRPQHLVVQPHSNGIWSKVPKKPKFVQSAWCEVCKINCNSSDVFTKHILGKKHLKNLEKLAEPKKDTSTSASTAAQVTTNPIIGPTERLDASKGKSTAWVEPGKRPAQLQTQQKDLDIKKQKIVEGGAAAGAVRACTICNVVCNSQTVFNIHLSGQKHAAMVKKLGESTAA